MATFQEIGEFEFIDHIAAHIQTIVVRCGIGDDCAVMDIDAHRVRLVTTDLMVEHVHFVCDSPPEGVGHKLLAVSLSDVAAMGGKPTDAVVSVAVPTNFDVGYVERIYTGLYACAERFGVAIVGGDTTRSPEALVLNLTLTGEMAKDRVCYRSGAQPGDLICVSGTLGDAAGGLAMMRGDMGLSREDRAHLLRQFNRPEPRVVLGQTLAETGVVKAMMDVSDGVASDMRHMCRRSGVSAILQETAIPMSDAFVRFCEKSQQPAVHLALSGGEDYELLFVIAADQWPVIDALTAQGQFPSIQVIGRIIAGKGEVWVESAEGVLKPPVKMGYDHFKS